MIKILDLVPIKKGFIKLDYEQNDERHTYVMHQETVFKHRLSKQQTLTVKEFKSLQEEDLMNQTYIKAIQKLAYSNHTEKSLLSALQPLEVPKVIKLQVIELLKEQNYLDDNKLFNQYVEEFIDYEIKGPALLKQKLLKAGFSETKINEKFALIAEEVWEQKCKEYLKTSSQRMRQETQRIRDQKLKAKAYQQGFSTEVINRIIASLDYFEDEDQLLIEKLTRYKKRYDLNNIKEKQKLIQKLQREGFTYEAIKNHLK